MKSPHHAYLPKLDHLRLAAAVSVFYFHAAWRYGYQAGTFAPIEWLRSGVSLFLCLSGFLFTILLHDKRIDYAAFLRNRALRIAPLYALAGLLLFTAGRGELKGVDLLNYLLLATNLGHPGTGFGEQFFPSGVTWTIAVEAQFYLLLPFLLAFARKRGPLYLLQLVALFVALRYFFALEQFPKAQVVSTNAYHSLLGRMDQFLIGMLFGYVHVGAFKAITPGRARLLAAACVALGAVAFARHDLVADWFFVTVWGFPFEGMFFAGLVHLYVNARFSFPAKVDALLARAGEASYSLYLLHNFMAAGVIGIWGAPLATGSLLGDLALNGTWVLAVCLVVSWVSFKLIEEPFLSLRKPYAFPLAEPQERGVIRADAEPGVIRADAEPGAGSA